MLSALARASTLHVGDPGSNLSSPLFVLFYLGGGNMQKIVLDRNSFSFLILWEPLCLFRMSILAFGILYIWYPANQRLL